jgi:acetyltransferase
VISPGHYLRPLLAPESVALIGASAKAESLGRIVYQNLLAGGFRGELFAVNPNHATILDRPAFPSLTAIGKPVDLAVICAPPAAVPAILDEMRQRARGAVILSGAPTAKSADFQRWRREIAARARASRIRVVGPASFGVIRTSLGLNASYSAVAAAPGRLSLISQSGAVCGALLDFARTTGMGFASVVSLGGTADVDFGEVLEFALADAETDGIVLYIETLRDARSFLSALRAAARTKPVIVLKAGRHPARMVADDIAPDRVFETALKRAGTVRVHTYAQLFASARVLASGRIPRSNRLAIVTNGRGPGLLAMDRAAETDVVLADLSAATRVALAALLPPEADPGNPVDVRGEATPARFGAAVTAVLADPGVDAVLALHVPVPAAPPAATAEAVAAAARTAAKPVLAAWLGVIDQPDARVALESGGIANFFTPEIAVDAFASVAAYRRNQEWLLEVPPPLPALSAPDLPAAERVRAQAIAANRSRLADTETAALLSAFGIPAAPLSAVSTVAAARAFARRIGYPVVLGRDGDGMAVRTGLRDGRMLERAWAELVADRSARAPGGRRRGFIVRKQLEFALSREVRIAARTDPLFGPVIGYGATSARARELALMLPPLNRRLAVDLIAGAHVAGASPEVQPLVALLLELSALLCALPWVVEMELDPVVVSPVAAVVARARVNVDPSRIRLADGYRHMAIHPYPVELETSLHLRSGEVLKLRPIRPEDADLERAFVAGMSEQSRYRRFMQHLPALTPQMLARFTQVDYDRELALIALDGDPPAEAIVAVARYVGNPDHESAEFAIAVADAWHGRGLGRAMMQALIACANKRGFRRLVGVVLASNEPMLAMCRKLGFAVERDPEDPEQVVVTLDLRK